MTRRDDKITVSFSREGKEKKRKTIRRSNATNGPKVRRRKKVAKRAVNER